MKITTPCNAVSLIVKSFGLGLVIFSSLFGAQNIIVQADTFPDTIFIPVTFYDFHPNRTNDFQMCQNPGGATPTNNNPYGSQEALGMVENRISQDRKPVMASNACKSQVASFPCACNLDNWFKPSGIGSSTVEFKAFDTTVNNLNTKIWRWTGLTRSTTYSTANDVFWVGPEWNANDNGANLVYYSALPFVLDDPQTGVYKFDRRRNQDQNNPFFWLDNKGFGTEPSGSGHNFAFTMELHHEFTYRGNEVFDFSGDDDVWVFINDRLALDIGGVHNEMRGGFELSEIAEEFELEIGDKYYLDVFYAERHTTESNCYITTNLIRPQVDTFFLTVDKETLCPGKQVTIIGNVLNKEGKHMPQVEDSIEWKIIPDKDSDPNDKLLETKGKSVRLTATKAWRTINVQASAFDPYTPDNVLRGIVPIYVVPCEPHHIVIEGSDKPEKWGDHPLPSVTIGPSENEWTQTYAVLRDPFENLYDTITKFTDKVTTNWESGDPSVVTATGETGRAYHGIVTRVADSGQTILIASDGNLIPDTVDVELSVFYIVRLRLVDTKTGKVVDTLRIWTNDIGDYRIEGLKSTAKDDPGNPSSWVVTPGKVDLLDTLKSAEPLQDFGTTWKYSPTNHGVGRVVLTNPRDSKTETTVIPVFVSLSPPEIYLNIVTPASKRIAGDTILVEISIKNDDGYIPIPYCFGGQNADIKDSIAYFDNLGRGGNDRPEPYTIVENKVLLNFDNEKYKNHQCFENGRDTFGVVLFYAPFEPEKDSNHVISAYAGSLFAETDRFKLLPGPLNRLSFENSNYEPYRDTIFMNPDDATFGTYSVGYDKYGNRIGREPATEWSVTGDLDPSKLSVKFGESNTYRTLNERDGMIGKLVGEAKGKNDALIHTDLPIVVRTPPSKPVSAFTRDISGNGYLDRIDVVFNKKTAFSLDDGNISIANISTSTTFPIDSIVPADDGDTLYYIYLKEVTTLNAQTGWTPQLMLSNFSTIENIPGQVISDGAAPVVWSAKVDLKNSRDPKKAVVTIVLSERVETSGSQNLATVETNPGDVFKIWEKVNDEFVQDDLLSEIENFNRIDGESFEFTMKNGKEITNNNYVNIYWSNRLIADEKGNFTNENNQKVPLVIIGQYTNIKILPNPARPTTTFGTPGKLDLTDMSRIDAYNIVKNGGAIIRLGILKSDSTKLKLTLKVYDVAGNQVISAKKDDVFKERSKEPDSSNMMYLHYAWNLTNAKGMKIAPGHYRVIAWLDYSNPAYKDEKHSVGLGVKK
ncbi:MAG: fibro-slime domain-containing protein [Chitinispirillaceae bacterium]|nr:fibro-slime domain-containing protein [Chitinispirillaceae bacterium]